eukprot:4852968-Ditylum_brightwellii.AAC.1
MSHIFLDIECVIVYMDDIIIIGSGTLAKHLKDIEKDQLEYLGFTILINGIKPQKKKIEDILRTAPPNNQKQVR